MTTEAYNPPSPITIATVGPHAIPFPYNAGAVRATVKNISTGELTELVRNTDFSITPNESETTGNLTLEPSVFAASEGQQLLIWRGTAEFQGWAAVQGAREKGMERQLDRLTRRIQEVSVMARSAVRGIANMSRFVPKPGKLIMFDLDGQAKNGPAPEEIAAMAASNFIAGVTLVGAGGWFALTGTSASLVVTSGNNLSAAIAGQKFRAVAMLAATGAATIRLDDMSPVAVLTLAGGAVPANHWLAGQELEFTYDGAAWRVKPIKDPGVIGPVTLSGTSWVDFAGIPAWATEIDLVFDGVSNSVGFSGLYAQLGTTSGIETSGYNGSIKPLPVPGITPTDQTDKFVIVHLAAAGDTAQGHLRLLRIDPGGNTWIATSLARLSTSEVSMAVGSKTVSDSLDRVRLLCNSGVLDAGRATLSYR